MIDPNIKEEIDKQLDILPLEEQKRVLDFARALAVSLPRGVPGEQLLRFAGTLGIEDTREMAEAIEDGCEQVDIDEW